MAKTNLFKKTQSMRATSTLTQAITTSDTIVIYNNRILISSQLKTVGGGSANQVTFSDDIELNKDDQLTIRMRQSPNSGAMTGNTQFNFLVITRLPDSQ